MKKEQTYAEKIVSTKVDTVGVAEEDYVTQEHLDAYEQFVTDVQTKYNLKTREEAQAKAQSLIIARQTAEREAREARDNERVK